MTNLIETACKVIIRSQHVFKLLVMLVAMAHSTFRMSIPEKRRQHSYVHINE